MPFPFLLHLEPHHSHIDQILKAGHRQGASRSISPGLHCIEYVSRCCRMLRKGRTLVGQFLASPEGCMIYCHWRSFRTDIFRRDPERVGNDGGGRAYGGESWRRGRF